VRAPTPHQPHRRARTPSPVVSSPGPPTARAPRRGPPPHPGAEDRREVASLGPADKAPYRPGSARHAPGCAVIATKAVGQARAQPTALVRLDITRALCLLPAVTDAPVPTTDPRRGARAVPSAPGGGSLGKDSSSASHASTRDRARARSAVPCAGGRTGAPTHRTARRRAGAAVALRAAAPPALVPRAPRTPPPPPRTPHPIPQGTTHTAPVSATQWRRRRARAPPQINAFRRAASR